MTNVHIFSFISNMNKERKKKLHDVSFSSSRSATGRSDDRQVASHMI